MTLIAGCGLPPEELEGEAVAQTMSWEEFLTVIHDEPDSDVYVVNGDETIEGMKRLREFYEERIQKGKLIVNTVGGADDKWNNTQKLNISYCVSSSSFGTRYNETVTAMANAAAAWEQVANVNFVHLSQYDSNCTASQSGVVFDVRMVNTGGQYLARAFFPYQSRSTRNVLIDTSAYGSTGDPSLTGVLRHELGHTLGFRHEHTRPEAGTCFEDNNWRALTTYDSASVMHYPQCNGTGDWSLTLTTRDSQGAAALYGAPGTDPDPDPDPGTGEEVTETRSGSVTSGEQDHFGPFNVVPGTTFSVQMSGSGDPDLYVRFGSAPTTSSYNCRPYLYGASESCNLSVPAGVTTAYIMVRGYSSGSYSLTINYTTPGDGGGGTGTPTTETRSGSVAQGEQDQIGGFSVLAGTTFSVQMTGSGDPDLYVRWSAAPTTSSYNCRPYIGGASESCNLTVPSGVTSAYVMVRGYTSGTYNLTINYTKP